MHARHSITRTACVRFEKEGGQKEEEDRSDNQVGEQEAEDLKTQLERLSQTNARLAAEAEQLQRALGDRAAEVDHVKTCLAAAMSDHAACSDIIASKMAEIDQLATRLRAAEDSQSSLGDEAAALRERTAHLELEHTPCAELIAQLQRRLAEMQVQVASGDSKVEARVAPGDLTRKGQDKERELGAAVAIQDSDELRQKLALVEAEMQKEVGFPLCHNHIPCHNCLSMLPCWRALALGSVLCADFRRGGCFSGKGEN